jgi:hypothetical protein
MFWGANPVELLRNGEVLTETHGLRKGDLVRVTRQNRMPRYEPGDRGLIVMGPNGLGGNRLYYLVMMDKDVPARLVIFAEDEIEADR